MAVGHRDDAIHFLQKTGRPNAGHVVQMEDEWRCAGVGVGRIYKNFVLMGVKGFRSSSVVYSNFSQVHENMMKVLYFFFARLT